MFLCGLRIFTSLFVYSAPTLTNKLAANYSRWRKFEVFYSYLNKQLQIKIQNKFLNQNN